MGAKLCINAQLTIVTVHICTVTVACAFNILIISDSLLFFSLSSLSAKLTLPLMFFLPLIPHAPIDTKSKINHKINKKNQPLEQNRWIGVDGNR